MLRGINICTPGPPHPVVSQEKILFLSLSFPSLSLLFIILIMLRALDTTPDRGVHTLAVYVQSPPPLV